MQAKGAAASGSIADSPIASKPRRFSTRRRLIAAFAAVLAAFVSALAFQIAALRRMEVTFEGMREREVQLSLALEVEEAVRQQYQQQMTIGDGFQLLEYEKARSQARELIDALRARAGDPAAKEMVGEIARATAELDRLFREEISPAVLRGDPRARPAQERSYPLVSIVEKNTDGLVARLGEATSQFRRELVELEAGAVRRAGALLVVTPLFIAAAVLYLSRSVARPLARLSEGAAAIAAGDLGAQIHIHSPDEFGALAAQFNAMTVALKRQQEKLVESEKLAGIGRLAAGLAHELNNPLQVMLGYLSLNRDLPDRRLAGHLAAVEEEVLRCKEIIEDLLELSRPAVAPVPVELRELCEEVAGGLRIGAQADGVRLSVDGVALALADRPRLRQVVFNLMKNAVEAAGAGGEVSVLLGASEERVELTVRDSGPGIAPEARARLFEPFFTTKLAGTGLGLAVSRAIALAHGGDIDVQNSSSGGAVFTLRLPPTAQGRS